MWVKILLLFFVFSFLFRTDHALDQDLGRHIKLGEIIAQTHQIPKINLFSYTNGDFPFINTHWLFEVVAYFFSQTVGLQALLILKVIIFLTAVWLILKIIPKGNQALLLPIGFIFLHVLRERLELRPEIFSFLFTACTHFILEKYSKSKLIFVLPIIQLIWINTHIYFFVGLIMQLIFIIYNFRKKGLLLPIFILSVFLSLINPNGLEGFLYPLSVTKNYGYSIVENQTLFFLENISFKDHNFIFVKLSWGIATLALVVTLIRRNFDFKNILLALAGMGLSLMNVRSFPYLVFLSLPATLQNFGTINFKNLTRILTLIFALFLVFESLNYLNGEYYRQRDDERMSSLGEVEKGKAALDFLIKNDLPNPIFNNFDIGSYIIYRGFPKYKVFVDGRPEAYPAQFFSDIYIPIQSDYQKFKQAEKEFGFKTVIFSHTDQTPWGINFLGSIIKDADWKLVYVDDFMVIFTKKDLTVVNLDQLNPDSYHFTNHVSYLRIGLFLLKTNHIQAGKKFVEKAYAVYPKSPVASSLLISGKNIPQ